MKRRNGSYVVKDGQLVQQGKKSGPPTFEERIKQRLSPLAFYGIKPSAEGRVTVTVYKDRFVLLDVRAPRKGEGPTSYAIAIREALRAMS